MRAWLISGLWLLACSSGVDHSSSPAAPAGSGGMPTAGVAATQAGGASSGSQAVSAGSGGLTGGGTAGQPTSGSPAQAGTGGVVASAGAAGASVGGSAGAVAQAGGGSGGLPATGGATAAAGEGGDSPGGASGAGGDGGAPADCVCAAGPCCDGCHFLPPSHFCGEVVRSSSCLTTTRIENDYWNLFCNGDAAACTRWAVHTKFVDPLCGDGLSCGGADGSAACN